MDAGKENKLEYIAPPLHFLCFLYLRLQSGVAIRTSMYEYIGTVKSDFSDEIREFLRQWESHSSLQLSRFKTTPVRSAIFQVLDRGLAGQPISEAIEELLLEVKEISSDVVERQTKRLAFISLIPLLFLQFPALMLIAVVPLLWEVLL